MRSSILRRAIKASCLLILNCAAIVPGHAQGNKDVVFISNVSPGILTDGVRSDVAVSVTYCLDSQERGVLIVGYNELNPDSCNAQSRIPITKGSASVMVKTAVVPRFWSDAINFQAIASIECSADDGAKRWLAASDHRTIELKKGAALPESNKVNSRPKETFADGLTILSILPESFKENTPQEIVVRVRYELFSRDEGEINLGFNDGMPNGYKIISSKRLKIGSGEMEIKGSITPAKTGELPFAKVYVNLSEYPHRSTWSPLANDSLTIAVE